MKYPLDSFYFVGFQPDSLIDFPPYISVVFYTSGCVFRCPYCFNKSIVEDNTGERFSVKDILAILKELNTPNRVVDGIVISGGEPLLHTRELKPILELLKLEDYKIKIDTTLACSNISDILEFIDGVSVSIKSEKKFNSVFHANIKKVNNSNLELKELRVILTKENFEQVRDNYIALLNNEEVFTPSKWKLHIDKAIKGREAFGQFTVLSNEELFRLRDSWPRIHKFKKLTWTPKNKTQ